VIKPSKDKLMFNAHFIVDGALLEAWASNKSFHPRDPDDNKSPDRNSYGYTQTFYFRGQTRINNTPPGQGPMPFFINIQRENNPWPLVNG